MPLALDEVLTHRGTGQAVVTVLNESGRPTPVAPTSMWTPLASWDRQALTLRRAPNRTGAHATPYPN
ncbi:helicase HerA-like domain-containing protein [Schaalia turicensis]|uniref:helicase HerA-like domain-containing protein n=1 Tax=Schaalia turicensis TaxID=131111 RepID=UPI0034A55CCE